MGLLAARGDSSAVRISYLRGEVELMTPSATHEPHQTTIARLLEVWSIEQGVDLAG
ncbi:MAG: hypothetical protein IRZ16_20510 [Myxococcaceae bacterium]|nr:hypothetical protein [Myxococcaceae bacterium]